MSQIRWKRGKLLVVSLAFSSACLVLWVLMFIASSNYNLGSRGDISQTAHDKLHPDGQLNRPPGVLDINLKDSKAENSKPNKQEKLLVEPPVGDVDEGPVLIPDNSKLREMTWAQLSHLYHQYLRHPQVKCNDIVRIGKVTDGGWDVCNDDAYSPKSGTYVYSFGIGNDFSFDDALIKKYNCPVFSFDPSMAMGHTQRSPKSLFYRQGIADSDRTMPNGWVVSRFETIKASLKHSKNKISLIKLDIEEMEWEVLPDLLTSDQLRTVDQILVELHQCEGCSTFDPKQEDKEASKDRYIHMLEILHDLYVLGFRIFHRHDNQACWYLDKFTLVQRSACVEVGFLKVSR